MESWGVRITCLDCKPNIRVPFDRKKKWNCSYIKQTYTIEKNNVQISQKIRPENSLIVYEETSNELRGFKSFLSWVLAPGFMEWLKSGQPIDYRKLSKKLSCALFFKINETPDRLYIIT